MTSNWITARDYGQWLDDQEQRYGNEKHLSSTAITRGRRVPEQKTSLNNWGDVEGQEELF